MIDLHCHILPGIDDGPDDLGTALQMAALAVADGVHTVVATPHVNTTLLDPQDIAHRIQQFTAVLEKKKIPLTIVQGADVHAAFMPAQLSPYTINGSRYILVEFPPSHLPSSARDFLFGLLVAGMQPIITHPERNRAVAARPHCLDDLLAGGALLQITAGSLIGDFGVEAQACGVHLLEQGMVAFLASDGHGVHWRPPVLGRGLRVAEKIIGAAAARRLVVTNPAAVLADAEIYA